MESPEDQVIKILQQCNVVQDGHFVSNAMLHFERYVAKDSLYLYPHEVSIICRFIAKHYQSRNYYAECVVAPAVGGVALSQWVAYWLTELTGRQVLAVFADKIVDGGMVIGRTYKNVMPYKRVLVVEDILTTGGSVKKTIAAARKLQANVVGVAALWNRGGVSPADLGVTDLYCLVNQQLPMWSAEECLLCKKGVPVRTDLGHGKEFLEQQKIES